MNKEYIRMCPECKSTNVSPDMSADSYSKGLLNQYKCNDCGFSGIGFPEILKADVEKIKANNQK